MQRRLTLAIAGPCLLALFAACGGDDGGDTIASAGTIAAQTPATAATDATAVDTSSAPELETPASRYSILLDDVGTNWITDIPATFTIDTKGYANTGIFESPEEGERLLTEWGYRGGYETSLQPEGREVGVLNGAYYVFVETHLFENEEGAKAAYRHFNGILEASRSDAVSSAPIGNESSAWTAVEGKVRDSSVDAAYHRIIFRRGNLLAVVATYGAEPFMKIEDCYRMASIVDEKALSKRDATEPTPTSNHATPTFARDLTPAPTAEQ